MKEATENKILLQQTAVKVALLPIDTTQKQL